MLHALLYERAIQLNQTWDSFELPIYPPEVRVARQEHLQSFHAATAQTALSRAWQDGDFIKHHPGCHYYKVPCQQLYQEAQETPAFRHALPWLSLSREEASFTQVKVSPRRQAFAGRLFFCERCLLGHRRVDPSLACCPRLASHAAMADLGEIWEQAKRFQDRRVVELASQAIRRRSEIESLVGAAEALRLLVAAKLALLEDAIEVARAGLHSSALRTDARADALRLLALAEAVRGSSGAERQYSEAIAAAEKAFLFFMDHGDERHQVDASVALSHLHLLRGESGDLHLATQAAERAVASAGAWRVENGRQRGQALLARAHAAHATAQGDRRGAHAHEDELALRWADEALELAQELGDAPLEPRSDAAATLLQAKEALDLLQELGASSHRQIALTRLAADAAVQLKDPQQGVRLCQQLVRLCRVEKAEVPGVFAALQLLRTLVAAQRWEEAKTTGHEILSFCQQKEDLLCEAQVLRLLLEAYRKSSASESLGLVPSF
eukprot:g22300.t1